MSALDPAPAALGDPPSAFRLLAADPAEYLEGDEVIDIDVAGVQALAASLRRVHPGADDFARAAFEHVRDSIAHSWDVQDRRVTLTASEVLQEGVGLCYGKAHLLTALLRAQRVPAGLCYQRLTEDGRTFDLHGLVAVHLAGAWHRQDPRGNKPGVDAQFRLASEQLAWPARPELGERDYPQVLVWPAPQVVSTLRSTNDMLALCRGGLPSEL